MSSKKDPQLPAEPKGRFSRRGFIQRRGHRRRRAGNGPAGKRGGGRAGRASVAGPGAVPITLNINGKPVNLTVEPASPCSTPCATSST